MKTNSKTPTSIQKSWRKTYVRALAQEIFERNLIYHQPKPFNHDNGPSELVEEAASLGSCNKRLEGEKAEDVFPYFCGGNDVYYATG